MRNTLLGLFTAFFIPLPVMIVLFLVAKPLFYPFMEFFWVQGADTEFSPTLWGWIFFVISVVVLVAGLYLAHSKENILSYALTVLAGIFLQLILTGIYVKVVW